VGERLGAAHRFVEGADGTTQVRPAEVRTEHAPVCPMVMEERLSTAWHRTDRYASNRVEGGSRVAVAFDELALAV
jgi:hypothetical protein